MPFHNSIHHTPQPTMQTMKIYENGDKTWWMDDKLHRENDG